MNTQQSPPSCVNIHQSFTDLVYDKRIRWLQPFTYLGGLGKLIRWLQSLMDTDHSSTDICIPIINHDSIFTNLYTLSYNLSWTSAIHEKLIRKYTNLGLNNRLTIHKSPPFA